MKLIKGCTLEELRNQTDSLQERGRLVAVFEQVCQAVGYAHARDVVHRDLKPANVMVGAFGEVQVMDWGLAKLLRTEKERARVEGDPEATTAETAIQRTRELDDETQAGSVLGTPAYMPPEQAIGAVDQIDQRSDVFGLGAVLCAILTGKPPYLGADAESTRQLAARAKLDDAFARLAACGAEPELVALCKGCLSVEKADRPADAGEVAKAVAGLRMAADERARQAEVDRAAAAAEAREQRKRRRVQLVLAAAVLLFFAGAALAAFSHRRS
jgi:serine/threonine protein kinase